ncbi:AGAP007083-PA-like protein [Anopheles sinensis]|uniref:AGAP007083-PA-like protein n=1 Tax=Anopheles sinensis TaxID=74873 RepID=A0A084WEE4_ANOSI|nr:AGAP007083-PA-like protein [Anopheles sinensis]
MAQLTPQHLFKTNQFRKKLIIDLANMGKPDEGHKLSSRTSIEGPANTSSSPSCAKRVTPQQIPEVTTKHQQYMQKYGTGKPAGKASSSNEKATGTTSPPPVVGGGGTAAGPGQPQVRFGKSLVAEANTNFRKGSPREKLIQDLAHTDLPTILNTDTIDRRNRMLAEEESRRKMDYQKELIKQIEEKRKEVERLREKEKLEEEMLTSRLEQQLKTMQLEEQLEHERLRSEKIRIANEQNHIRRLQLLANLENDHKLFNPYDGQRKAFSENGGLKPSIPPATKGPGAVGVSKVSGSFSSGDERTKVYRYFSNSAHQEKHAHFAEGSVGGGAGGPASSSTLSTSEQDYYESSSETTGLSSLLPVDHRYQYCKSCRADIDRSFLPPTSRSLGGTTKGSKQAKRLHCAKCGCKRSQGGKEDGYRRCTSCARTMKRTNNSESPMCAVCQLATDADRNHQKQRHRRVSNTREEEDTDARVSPTANPYKVIDIQYHESDNEQGGDHLSVLNPVIVRNNYRKPPFSLNINKDSLFHPSKKTPEPVLSVNIRNGEVFVDNKLRGSSRPASPSDVDDRAGAMRDDETSSATVGDDLLDERIAKYVRHYNTLWMKRGTSRKNNAHNFQSDQQQKYDHDQQHHHHQYQGIMKSSKSGSLLPSLSPPKVYVSDRPDNLKSDGLKLVEKKWEIPAVERTKVNNKGSARVLTQLGAIRRQLQLEQLQMDGPSSYGKNY